MSKPLRSLMVGASLAALATGAAGLACAEPAPAASTTQTISEVVVTASKQGAQTLLVAPLAIQAFGGAQLEAAGVHQTGDLIAQIPGADTTETVGSVIRSFSLRGSGAGGAVGDSMIGYYIDDVPFSVINIQIAPPIRFLDLQRVEVLRGPQGTLYGQGSMGGTFVYHTKDPSLTAYTFEGEVSGAKTEDASKPNYGASAAVSLPLIKDQLGLRITAGYDKRAGYVDVYSGAPTGAPRAKDANDITSSDVRAVLLWRPNDQLKVRAQYWHFEPKQDYTQSLISLKPPYLSNYADIVGFERANGNLYGLTVDYDAGPVTVTSSTGYLSYSNKYLAGTPFVPVDLPLYNGYPTHSLTEELRVKSNGTGPFHWVVGGFYQDATSSFEFNLDNLVVGATATHTKNYSTFGEVSYDLFGGKLVPLAGIRYYHDDRTFTSHEVDFGFPGPNGGGTAKPNVVTWRFNLAYYPTPDLTMFATASNGFRAGITQSQFQTMALAADGLPAKSALDPDKLNNYEVGLKARLADGRVQVGLNAYLTEIQHLQTGVITRTLLLPAFLSCCEADTEGLDLEVRWRTPIAGLDLGFTGNINDSKYKGVNPAITPQQPGIREGGRLAYLSKYSYRFEADYSREIAAGWMLHANGSAATNSDRVMLDGYVVRQITLANASIGLSHGAYDITLFGENLGDERGPTFVRASTLFAGPFPRTVGVKLHATFD